MNKVKTAVIGTGYLGKYHVEKFAHLPSSELVAICDVDMARCHEFANQYGVDGVLDYKTLVGKVDAVSIVTPTPLHFEIGMFFLSHGIHVLMEKPIATTIDEAEQLIKTARANHALLQVGHLERFNNTVKELNKVLFNPRFIESTRLAPFKLRGSDVNVILDLMIHDIDIIQSIVKADITDIRASGASVLSEYIDIANARLEFANGCVANVTASRVSLKMKRELAIFQHDCYIGLDLHHKKLTVHRKGPGEMFPGIPEIIRERQVFEKGDPLNEQIEAFLDSILYGTPIIVSGEDGLSALKTALDITNTVWVRNERHPIVEHETMT